MGRSVKLFSFSVNKLPGEIFDQEIVAATIFVGAALLPVRRNPGEEG
jgi:hypothetical protein